MKLKISRKKRKELENDTKVLNKSAENMQINLTEQGGFDCCQVKQYEKECKGQTKNSRNS